MEASSGILKLSSSLAITRSQGRLSSINTVLTVAARHAMGIKTIWKNYKVLIVMVPSLVLIHWGWYNIKSNPVFQPKREDTIPEPGIVTYVLQQDSKSKGK